MASKVKDLKGTLTNTTGGEQGVPCAPVTTQSQQALDETNILTPEKRARIAALQPGQPIPMDLRPFCPADYR